MTPTRLVAGFLATLAALTIAAAPDADTPAATPGHLAAVGVDPAPTSPQATEHASGPMEVPTEVSPATEPVTAQRPDPEPTPPDGAADPGTADLLVRTSAAFTATVPPRWLEELGDIIVVPGVTSYADPNGEIGISKYHASGPWERLRAVVGHEVGHIVAFRYGTDGFHGAPPEGFPSDSTNPELWADCTARTWSGNAPHGRNGTGCPQHLADWAGDWLAAN